MPNDSQELTSILRREIERSGPLSFARFMNLALYHPVHGYYEQPLKQIGCQGDFFTSVSTGNLFGRLLAFQFAAWLQRLHPQEHPRPPRAQVPAFHLLEAGAHDGRLGWDILSWFETRRPDLLERITYTILEPSPARKAAQAERLGRFHDRVHWVECWDNVAHAVRGIIFSNELLDAFPVHRLGWNRAAQHWFEWKVGWGGERFVWVHPEEPADSNLCRELQEHFGGGIPPELLAVLPDGFTVEICPAARRWWTQAAERLREGVLVTLDYGLEAQEFFVPHRPNGTLRGFRQHQQAADPLADPGRQDLTAHVNFSALQNAGEAAGLQTEGYGPQGTFLTRIATEALAAPDRFGSWSETDVRQLHTLTHPTFLGRSFQALRQARWAS